ncbi:MAG: hypothetical protein HXY47_04105 [Nitrospirae bacterium]|nr:hypothetical protein [Nitrospirota bacterium]
MRTILEAKSLVTSMSPRVEAEVSAKSFEKILKSEKGLTRITQGCSRNL